MCGLMGFFVVEGFGVGEGGEGGGRTRVVCWDITVEIQQLDGDPPWLGRNLVFFFFFGQ